MARDSRRLMAKTLASAVATFQAETIIPHCKQCKKPCCKLETLVLEINWKQLKTFWQRTEPRATFDRCLASGKGPQEIRAGNGLYYAHGKACPAYDEANQLCKVYDHELKPVGCTDFPVYQDQGYVIADRRCEAVDLKLLKNQIAQSAGQKSGQNFSVVQSADKEFPFLVSLSLKRVSFE